MKAYKLSSTEEKNSYLSQINKDSLQNYVIEPWIHSVSDRNLDILTGQIEEFLFPYNDDFFTDEQGNVYIGLRYWGDDKEHYDEFYIYALVISSEHKEPKGEI